MEISPLKTVILCFFLLLMPANGFADPALVWVHDDSHEVMFNSDDIVRFDWNRQLFELKPEKNIDHLFKSSFSFSIMYENKLIKKGYFRYIPEGKTESFVGGAITRQKTRLYQTKFSCIYRLKRPEIYLHHCDRCAKEIAKMRCDLERYDSCPECKKIYEKVLMKGFEGLYPKEFKEALIQENLLSEFSHTMFPYEFAVWVLCKCNIR